MNILHGGKRPGAGRKAGSSPYGERTKVMRIPHSVASVVEGVLAAQKAQRVEQRAQHDILRPALDSTPVHVPLFSHKVAAGFPSPADDYVQRTLSLDEHLIQHKVSTFFMRAKGDSMVGAGIFDGDLLVVDKSLTPTSGDIVIAIVDGDFTVKRFTKRGGTITLRPENPRYKEIEFKEGQQLEVWGVVTSAVKKFV